MSEGFYTRQATKQSARSVLLNKEMHIHNREERAVSAYIPWFIDTMAALAEKGDRDARNYLRDQAARGDKDAAEYVAILSIDMTPASPRCEHGRMTFVEHGGQRGFVCPVAKGDPDRCQSVMVEGD